MKRTLPIFLLATLTLSLGYGLLALSKPSSKAAEKNPSTVANAWFALQLELIESTPGFTPPVASRVFGYTGVALYESILPAMAGRRSVLSALGYSEVMPAELYELEDEYDWEVVANTTLATMTKRLFPNASEEYLDRILNLESGIDQRLGEQISDDVLERSKIRGGSIASAVLMFAETDGGNQGFETNFPETYQPPLGEGLWVSTPPKYQRALQPYWGENRYFLAETANCELAPPPEYSTKPDSNFYKEALEVYETTSNLTKEQNQIALFWADDPGMTSTPPGHWISILVSILEKENSSLAEAAEIYARLGIALSDSFVSCWDEKYTYNLVRPITYIQEHIDPAWNTPEITDPVVTPPFPEYPSGHSVQSAAAATVLSNFFGASYAFTDTTHITLGYEPRTYSSFSEAAAEVAISRLYGGIHYRAAIEEGMTLGNCIGEQVNGIQLQI